MTKEQREQVIEALVSFVERASKECAPVAEVQALPVVAKILIDADSSLNYVRQS